MKNVYKITSSTFQDAVSAIGGVIGAINIPERWFPGAVDMYLNSHNIMHVLVVTAVYFMHQVRIVLFYSILSFLWDQLTDFNV